MEILILQEKAGT